MAFGDKLRGGNVKNAGEKIGSKDFGSKVKGTDYGKLIAGNSSSFAKKLAGNGRQDDDNVATEAVSKGGKLARKLIGKADKSDKPGEVPIRDDGTSKIQKKGVAKKRKDLKNRGRNDDIYRDGITTGSKRAYSDKVFDQAKYNFKKRQVEAYKERLAKDKEAASYFDKLKARNDKESVFKDEKIDYGKYSKKLKRSKKKKTPYEEYEEKYMRKKKAPVKDDEEDIEARNARMQKERNAELERQKLIQDKEVQKDYERRMNQRMQYEHRYQKMQEHVKEVRFVGKQAKKRAQQEAKTYTMAIAMLMTVFIVLYTLSAGAIGMFIGSTGGSSMGASVTSVCWNSSRDDIDAAEEYFYQKFLALKAEIQALKDADDHDETVVSGILDYNHINFISFLSAFYNGSFTYDSSLESRLDSIFDDIFSYSYHIDTETRTRNVYDPDTDTWSDEDYDVDVLYIDIDCQEFDDYASSNLTTDQLNYYDTANFIGGGLQCFGAPSSSWRLSVIEYYTEDSGCLKTRSTYGESALAMREGTVTEVGTNYVKVEGTDGSSYKISGLASVTVTTGTTVTRGQAIGMTGTTMSVYTWIDGDAINPLFYVRLN